MIAFPSVCGSGAARSRPVTSRRRGTFFYRLRPSRAGDVVLPPISIASYDPSISRYLTQATPGVPVRVVAVSAFDPATIIVGERAHTTSRSLVVGWIAWSLSAAALAGVYLALVLVRRRLRQRRQSGKAAARRYAARLARKLSDELGPWASLGLRRASVAPTDLMEGPDHAAARDVSRFSFATSRLEPSDRPVL